MQWTRTDYGLGREKVISLLGVRKTGPKQPLWEAKAQSECHVGSFNKGPLNVEMIISTEGPISNWPILYFQHCSLLCCFVRVATFHPGPVSRTASVPDNSSSVTALGHGNLKHMTSMSFVSGLRPISSSPLSILTDVSSKFCVECYKKWPWSLLKVMETWTRSPQRSPLRFDAKAENPITWQINNERDKLF